VSCYEATAIVNLTREGRLSKAAGRQWVLDTPSETSSGGTVGPGSAGSSVRRSRVLLFGMNRGSPAASPGLGKYLTYCSLAKAAAPDGHSSGAVSGCP